MLHTIQGQGSFCEIHGTHYNSLLTLMCAHNEHLLIIWYWHAIFIEFNFIRNILTCTNRFLCLTIRLLWKVIWYSYLIVISSKKTDFRVSWLPDCAVCLGIGRSAAMQPSIADVISVLDDFGRLYFCSLCVLIMLFASECSTMLF